MFPSKWVPLGSVCVSAAEAWTWNRLNIAIKANRKIRRTLPLRDNVRSNLNSPFSCKFFSKRFVLMFSGKNKCSCCNSRYGCRCRNTGIARISDRFRRFWRAYRFRGLRYRRLRRLLRSGFRRRILNDCRAGSRCFAEGRRRAWEQVLCRFPAAIQVQMRDNIVLLCCILDRVLISRKGADRKQRYSQAKSKQYGCKFLHVFSSSPHSASTALCLFSSIDGYAVHSPKAEWKFCF